MFNLLKGQKADLSGYPHKEVQEHSSDQSPCLFTKMYALVTGKLPVQFSLEKLQTASILFIFYFFLKKRCGLMLKQHKITSKVLFLFG